MWCTQLQNCPNNSLKKIKQSKILICKITIIFTIILWYSMWCTQLQNCPKIRIIHLNKTIQIIFRMINATKKENVGNGQYPVIDYEQSVALDNTVVNTLCTTLDELKTSVYPNTEDNAKDHSWLAERCMLAPLNCNVDNIN